MTFARNTRSFLGASGSGWSVGVCLVREGMAGARNMGRRKRLRSRSGIRPVARAPSAGGRGMRGRLSGFLVHWSRANGTTAMGNTESRREGKASVGGIHG